MAGYADGDTPAPQQVTAARDAYVAGRDLHVHVRSPVDPDDWRARLGRRGLRIWTSELFAAGVKITAPAEPQPPMRQHEVVDAVMLGAGRLPNLQREFGGVGRAFDAWVRGGRRKRGADGSVSCGS